MEQTASPSTAGDTTAPPAQAHDSTQAGWLLLGWLSLANIVALASAIGGAAIVLYPVSVVMMERQLQSHFYRLDYGTAARAVSLMPTSYLIERGFSVLSAYALTTPAVICAFVLAFGAADLLVAPLLIAAIEYFRSRRKQAPPAGQTDDPANLSPGPPQASNATMTHTAGTNRLARRILDQALPLWAKLGLYVCFSLSISVQDHILTRGWHVAVGTVLFLSLLCLDRVLLTAVRAVLLQELPDGGAFIRRLALGLFLGYLVQLMHSYNQIPVRELDPPLITLRLTTSPHTLHGRFIARAESAWYVLEQLSKGYRLVTVPEALATFTCMGPLVNDTPRSSSTELC